MQVRRHIVQVRRHVVQVRRNIVQVRRNIVQVTNFVTWRELCVLADGELLLAEAADPQRRLSFL